jgi:hypothetical protein
MTHPTTRIECGSSLHARSVARYLRWKGILALQATHGAPSSHVWAFADLDTVRATIPNRIGLLFSAMVRSA